MAFATWDDALDYLYGLANWETRPPGTGPAFELDRIRAVLRDLGDPHHRWPAVHVAGTNGKGSTCAFVAAALQCGGYRTGLYSSPHLHTVRERIQVDGAAIGESEVLDWLARHRATLDRHAGLTTFEALTAMAFSHFARSNVELAVVEVGLGGRLDTTNVVQSIVSVLTPIGLDHTEVLGPTVALIAADKCGILRDGTPAVTAPQTGDVRAVIEELASARQAPLCQVGRHVTWRSAPDELCRHHTSITARWRGCERSCAAEVALAGPHQVVNAATAAGVVTVLASMGWHVGPEHLAAGLSTARWPARFERLALSPALIVDGAHNPDGAGALRAAVEECFPSARRRLLVGVGRGKDVAGLVGPLLPAFDTVTATRAAHPKALPADELAAMIGEIGTVAAAEPVPALALERLLADAAKEEVIVAAGSLFLAADVRMAWFERCGLPLPERDPPYRASGAS